MTTPISDEQLAEIERDILAQAQIMSGQCEGGVWLRGGDCPKCQATRHDRCQFPLSQSYAIPSNVEALIARLRAAEADVERLNKLDALCEAYGFEGIHEGNRWMIDGPYRDIRAAIDGIKPAMERTP
ncbi:TPA: hypothetical protein ACKR0C_005067 [Pseudomonas aeruginosa]|uniref:hypothetical protein n=1 Tax=Pseudomonas aeruginosa TaxID=287 RepID=UPI000A4E2CCC|nr:hypothetical protein [Pseudomonas aeruginosa]EKY0762954.1 hypothetical protein [Pseudomonas aeruginosa]EME0886763.1 hypothetical protein [Pseudomonas aeruginosa]MBX6817038.1 hypothetical protein [Pseudomonas aeruginosa]MCH0754230.1 hypothetical protein [Pseudomonas aeruginosa]MCT5234064.1 hypothetical protein [Pseudomonas aeruginosa]